MLKLSLDALHIIDAIDRRGSFAQAAKELFRVPSTVSYTVAKLEQDLGVALFERHGPRVTLTAAGQALLKEGRYLLKAASDLECRVRRVACGWETELTLTLDAMFATTALVDDIRAFYDATDQTRLRLDLECLSGTWEALLDQRADLLIGAAGTGPSGGGYAMREIGSLPFVFVVAPSHPLAGVTHCLSKADLQPFKAVAVADSTRSLHARTVGLTFGQDTLTAPDMRSKYQLQIAGLGFGFVPEPMARHAIANGWLIEKQVDDPRPPETFYLAWRSGEHGAALTWWTERLQNDVEGLWQRLCHSLPCQV